MVPETPAIKDPAVKNTRAVRSIGFLPKMSENAENSVRNAAEETKNVSPTQYTGTAGPWRAKEIVCNTVSNKFDWRR